MRENIYNIEGKIIRNYLPQQSLPEVTVYKEIDYLLHKALINLEEAEDRAINLTTFGLYDLITHSTK